MPSLKTVSSICAAFALVAYFSAGPASADDQGKKHHPRVAEVNRRENRLDKRIDKGVKKDQLSGAEAGQLRSEEERIHNEELQDEAAHHGHLTRAEKRHLNKEENALSHQIHKERHDSN